jgi:hypothetical protein
MIKEDAKPKVENSMIQIDLGSDMGKNEESDDELMNTD